MGCFKAPGKPGIKRTGPRPKSWFPASGGFSAKQVGGVTNMAYNRGNCGSKGPLKPAMFWFAAKNNDLSPQWMEQNLWRQIPFVAN
jgi:hypothetical protein